MTTDTGLSLPLEVWIGLLLCNKRPQSLWGSNNNLVTLFDHFVARERLGLSWAILLSLRCGHSAYLAGRCLVWSTQDGTLHVWSSRTPGLRQDSGPDYHWWPQGSQIPGCQGPWEVAARWPFMTAPQKSHNILPVLPYQIRGTPPLHALDLPHLASRCMTSQGPELLVKPHILMAAPAPESCNVADSNVHFSIQNFYLQIQSTRT